MKIYMQSVNVQLVCYLKRAPEIRWVWTFSQAVDSKAALETVSLPLPYSGYKGCWGGSMCLGKVNMGTEALPAWASVYHVSTWLAGISGCLTSCSISKHKNTFYIYFSHLAAGCLLPCILFQKRFRSMLENMNICIKSSQYLAIYKSFWRGDILECHHWQEKWCLN